MGYLTRGFYMWSLHEISIFQIQPPSNPKYIERWCCLSTGLVSRFFCYNLFYDNAIEYLFVCHMPLILRTQFYILSIISSIYYHVYKKFNRYGNLKFKMAAIDKSAKLNLLSLVSKQIPVIESGIISLTFNFQPYSPSNS